ncbi:MAG: AAA family ATPase, partial [Clostridium butyricum]|nr:AAA family ATPase [Clostridium butyricum]
LQGQYPVVFLSFKNQKHFNFSNLQDGIKSLMANIYNEHDYLLESDKLSQFDKNKFMSILNRSASIVDFLEAVSDLTRYLSKYYNQKVIVLIDEYDVPLQEAFIRGYYEEALVLVRNILTAALKDNVYLEKALVTRILRVAKESIFSGLNNLQVHTILSYKFNDKFGFEENEVIDLLKYYDLESKKDEVKNWYNGYMFGGKVIYNPWSVLNYIDNNEQGFMPYWINSSGNELIKRLLSRGTKETKECLEELIKGNAIVYVFGGNGQECDVSNPNSMTVGNGGPGISLGESGILIVERCPDISTSLTVFGGNGGLIIDSSNSGAMTDLRIGGNGGSAVILPSGTVDLLGSVQLRGGNGTTVESHKNLP